MEADDDDNCVVAGYLNRKDVLLNGWMFCADHSTEWCHMCHRDHRPLNTQQVRQLVVYECWPGKQVYSRRQGMPQPGCSGREVQQ